MNRPDFYCSIDYAGLTTRVGSFYYGYEVLSSDDEDAEWCFEAKIVGMDTIKIPFSKLDCKDQFDEFDVVSCLMMGIGWVLAKYNLSEHKDETPMFTMSMYSSEKDLYKAKSDHFESKLKKIEQILKTE